MTVCTQAEWNIYLALYFGYFTHLECKVIALDPCHRGRILKSKMVSNRHFFCAWAFNFPMQWLFLTWLYICEAWENMCNELNRAEGFYHKARNTSFPLHLESFKVQQDFRSRIMNIVSGPWKAKITSLRKSQTFSCHTRSIVAAKPCW